MTVFKKILYTTDFSEGSYLALDVAYRLASQPETELILMTAVPFPAPNPQGFKTERDAREQAIAEAKERLEEISEKQFSGCDNVSVIVESGNPAHQIVTVAQREGIDAIVISTQGRTGWRRLLLGSVTEEVLRTASCPVITVRQSEEEAIKTGLAESSG